MQKIKIINENIEGTDLVRVEIDHVVQIMNKDRIPPKKNNSHHKKEEK